MRVPSLKRFELLGGAQRALEGSAPARGVDAAGEEDDRLAPGYRFETSPIGAPVGFTKELELNPMRGSEQQLRNLLRLKGVVTVKRHDGGKCKGTRWHQAESLCRAAS